MKRFNCIALAFLLIFQLCLTPITANAEDSDSIVDTVAHEVIQKVTATKNGVELKDIENYRPEMGDTIDLGFDFTLPAGHNYGAGSTLTYPLPTPLKPVSGSGILSNESGEAYANFAISGGDVVITFNDKIRFQGAEGSGGLETIGYFEIEAEFEVDEENANLEQTLDLPGNDIIKLYFQPAGGTNVAKGVNAENNGNNSQYIEWTINVNTVMEDLGTAGKVFTDTIEGNHTYIANSLKVTRYQLNALGNRDSTKDIIVTTDYEGIFNGAATADAKNFTFNLTGAYAYEIVYQTLPGDTDEKSQILTNNAKFNGENAPGSATINYGDPLAKEFSKSGERTDWTITVNANRKTLAAGTSIIDGWDSDQHAIIAGTFKVNGSTELAALGMKVDYDADGQGFKLTLEQEITEEFTITYSTQPKDLVTSTIDIKNEVFRSDRPTDKKTKTAQYRQNVLSKSNANINYQDKTVDWTITLNTAGYAMDNIVLTDTFEDKNLRIVEGTLVVKQGSTELVSGSDYTRIDINSDGSENTEGTGDKKGGFKLTIAGSISEPVTITYTTEYDVRGVTNLDKYENTVGLKWKTDGKDYSSPDVNSAVVINTQQKNKGYKTGNYNYETKTFHWNVGVNYNFDTIVNPVFMDTLSTSQVVDRDSIEVYKLDLSEGGNGKIVGPALTEGNDYTLTPAPLANTFTITFSNTITEPYRIIYESSLGDDYYDPDGKDYSAKNEAVLNNGTWTTTIPVDHTDKLITKGYQQEGNSAKLHWSMNLNWGQSSLDNVVITDTVGKDAEGNPNQMVYKDSFKIYEMNFSGTNKTPSQGTGYLPGTAEEGLYYVTFDDPDSTFKIIFNEPVAKAYKIEYDTYFLGASGEKLANEAELAYTYKGNLEGDDQADTIKPNFSFSGFASATKGQLEITKVDKDDPTKKLSGAIFELWSAPANGFLIERVATDTDGEYKFLTKVGQTDYYLKETKAPEGYSLDDSGYKDLTKVNIGDAIQLLEIKNTILVQAVTLTKVDAADPSRKLAGAEFTLHDATTDEQVVIKDSDGNIVPQPLITDEWGEITVGNLTPGTYYFKETAAPAYYLQGSEAQCKSADFSITDNQIEVRQVEMDNTRGLGQIIITKVDGADKASLAEVEFTLTKKDLAAFSDGSLSKIAVTNAAGRAEFVNLPYDTYILTETSAHPNYVPNTEPQEIVLDGNQDAVQINIDIENNKKDHSVKLVKYNANKNLTLEGAVFQLKQEINGWFEVVTGIGVDQLTTDINGVINIKDLPAGKYQLIETKAPAGYRLNKEPLVFEIEENQTAAIQLEKTNLRNRDGGGVPDSKGPEEPTESEVLDEPQKPEASVIPAQPYKPGEGGEGAEVGDTDIGSQTEATDDISNAEDVHLPKTGGSGIIEFYLAGLGLVMVGLLLRRKTI